MTSTDELLSESGKSDEKEQQEGFGCKKNSKVVMKRMEKSKRKKILDLPHEGRTPDAISTVRSQRADLKS